MDRKGKATIINFRKRKEIMDSIRDAVNKAVFPFQYKFAKNVFSGDFPLNFDVRYPNSWMDEMEP